jgi:hypothetical protein
MKKIRILVFQKTQNNAHGVTGFVYYEYMINPKDSQLYTNLKKHPVPSPFQIDDNEDREKALAHFDLDTNNSTFIEV